MDFFAVLFFPLATMGIAFLVVFLSGMLSVSEKGEKVPEDAPESDPAPREHVELKFYKSSILFVVLCVKCSLLLPWILNVEEIFGKGEVLARFLFFVAVIVMGYIFVGLSGGFNRE